MTLQREDLKSTRQPVTVDGDYYLPSLRAAIVLQKESTKAYGLFRIFNLVIERGFLILPYLLDFVMATATCNYFERLLEGITEIKPYLVPLQKSSSEKNEKRSNEMKLADIPLASCKTMVRVPTPLKRSIFFTICKPSIRIFNSVIGWGFLTLVLPYLVELVMATAMCNYFERLEGITDIKPLGIGKLKDRHLFFQTRGLHAKLLLEGELKN
ncbi:hypothetical protein K435DRAFT_813003 [Dendrothele bispora CBS 962.96]|uniref:Uncharacterized protein n=1 Tax=Dendrothele bispora (strain CBS 962.96) TaxID=1314807 RepID=A0A4S8KML8_DENBC|nr:hypothetical protein K435DRAFT_813003 [Dendrothele bispora CBS 962.96]